MPSEQGEKVRPTNMLTIAAQGIGLSVLRNSKSNNKDSGDSEKDNENKDVFLWNGMRWLSGKNNPSNCTTLCTAPTGDCKQDSNYHTGTDFDYWIPLEFDTNGQIMQFQDFVDNFTLTIPVSNQLNPFSL